MLGGTWAISEAATFQHKFKGMTSTWENGVFHLRGTSPSEMAAAAVTVESGAIRAASNTNWYFGTGALLQNGGVTFNSVLPLAATAGAAAVTAVRANPAALLTSVVVPWLLSEGIAYVGDKFVKSNTVPNSGACVVHDALTVQTTEDQCGDLVLQSLRTNLCSYNQCTVTRNGLFREGGFTRYKFTVEPPVGNDTWGLWSLGNPNAQADADEADWARLRARVLPDNVATDMLKGGVPLPIQSPTFTPPYKDVPVSDPYIDPTTGVRWRDYQRITPSTTNPDTADVRVMKQKVDSSGNPTASPTPTADTDLCKLNPEASGCKPLDEVPDVEIPTRENPFSLNPVSGFGADNASCPASVHLFTKGGQSVDWSWSQFCTFSQGIRPFVIGFAWLAAIAMVVSVGRRAG